MDFDEGKDEGWRRYSIVRILPQNVWTSSPHMSNVATLITHACSRRFVHAGAEAIITRQLHCNPEDMSVFIMQAALQLLCSCVAGA